MFSRSSLIDSEDNLHINNLRLSPSILLFWRVSSHSDDASSPEREPTQVSRSPCQRFVSIVAVSVAWSLLRYSSASRALARSAGMSSSNFRRSNDLTAACSNSHHFENSELTRPEPKDSWIGTCLNFIHFDTQSRNQDIWLPSKRFVVTPAVYPRVFEILTTLTFGALCKNHIVSRVVSHVL